MYNCVVVTINGVRTAIFRSIDSAECYRSMYKQVFAHLNVQITCDWAYIEGVMF